MICILPINVQIGVSDQNLDKPQAVYQYKLFNLNNLPTHLTAMHRLIDFNMRIGTINICFPMIIRLPLSSVLWKKYNADKLSPSHSTSCFLVKNGRFIFGVP